MKGTSPMASASDYAGRVNEIAETINTDSLNACSSVTEAKTHKARFTQIQKQLRLIKKDIALEKKILNASYTTERTRVGKSFGAALFGGLFGRKLLGTINAATRDEIRRNQLQAVASYDAVDRIIDELILQLDHIKIQLDNWIIGNS
jgi:hypothetical protein